MQTWSPIASAPLDGTPILTDDGVCRYVDPKRWGCPMTEGWHHCDAHGDMFRCADDGYFFASPKLWIPLPRPEDATEAADEADMLRTQLEAWHKSFGTTQLTHAIARLDAAEAFVRRAKAS